MKNLFESALNCLKCSDPEEKITLSYDVISDWRANKLNWADYPENINVVVLFPDKPPIVEVEKVKKRGFNSPQQIASLLHSLAHIEITAVNLSWDAIIRFPHMPKDYYHDWVETAEDESRHFLALNNLMKEFGYEYGDFPVHNELWQMAVNTAADLKARMAIVHRVLEARALDVVPLSIEKFRHIGDKQTADALIVIANDEIGHVNAGSRWFRYCCDKDKEDSDTMFFKLMQKYLKSTPKGPFNREARIKAGFSIREMQELERLEHETDTPAAQGGTGILIEILQRGAEQLDPAACRAIQSGQQAQQGGFA